MSEFPPPTNIPYLPPQFTTPAPPPAPPKSKLKRNLLIGAAVVVGISVIGAALTPAEDETAAPVEAAAVVEVEVTEAPAKIEPAPEASIVSDEFTLWMVSNLDTLMSVGSDMQNVAPLLEAGDLSGAADASEAVGDVFLDLYLEAPETGTEMSDVGNEMLLTCSTAYTAAAIGIRTVDAVTLEDAGVEINRCGELLAEATALMEQEG